LPVGCEIDVCTSDEVRARVRAPRLPPFAALNRTKDDGDVPHAKKCPQCGFVGNYEPAQLLICESCGEVLAESWALNDAVTDIMDEGSWISEFRRVEKPRQQSAIGERPLAPVARDDAPPGMIGPGQTNSLDILFAASANTDGSPKLPPFPAPENTPAALLAAANVSPPFAAFGAGAMGGAMTGAVGGTGGIAGVVTSPAPNASPVHAPSAAPNFPPKLAPPSAVPSAAPSGPSKSADVPRIVVGRPASDVAPPIFAREKGAPISSPRNAQMTPSGIPRAPSPEVVRAVAAVETAREAIRELEAQRQGSSRDLPRDIREASRDLPRDIRESRDLPRDPRDPATTSGSRPVPTPLPSAPAERERSSSSSLWSRADVRLAIVFLAAVVVMLVLWAIR
jgi:hypothetical protein